MEEKNIAKLTESLHNNLNGIEDRGLMLSKENITGDIGMVGLGIKEYFRKEFLHIADSFTYDRNRLAQMESKEVLSEITSLVKLEPAIKRVISNVEYVNVAKIKLPVPVGMCTDMVTATDLITEANNNIEKYLIKTIDELDTIISKVIADESFRTSNRPILNKSVTKDNNTLLEETLLKIINPSIYEDRRTYEDLYPNVSSLESIYDKLTKVSTINNSKTLKKIDKLTKSISEKVKTLYDLSENIKTFKVSQNLIKNLSSELENCGKYVTSCVSIIHLNNQLAGTYSNTIHVLDKFS